MMDSKNSDFEITRGAAAKHYRKVGGVNNRRLSHCSGGYKSEIKIQAGLVPS